MARARWLVLALIIGLAACGDEAPPAVPGPLTLPKAFLGTWEIVGMSGGMDGEAELPETEEPFRFVITAENTLVPASGVKERSFVVKRGKTIFSSEDQWIVVFADMPVEKVLRLGPDDTLSMSDNEYDGSSMSCKRP